MVKGKIKIEFDDGDKFTTFCEMIALLKAGKVLPESLGWYWQAKENGFEATIYSKQEANVQEGGQADDPSGSDNLVDIQVDKKVGPA